MGALNPEPMFSLNNRNLKRATVAMNILVEQVQLFSNVAQHKQCLYPTKKLTDMKKKKQTKQF